MQAARNNPARSQYFGQIDTAISVQDQLSVLLEQGTNFYLTLNDQLVRLQQSIADFIFARNLERDELMQQIQPGW